MKTAKPNNIDNFVAQGEPPRAAEVTAKKDITSAIVRMPGELHLRAKILAMQNGETLHNFIVTAIRERVERDEK